MKHRTKVVHNPDNPDFPWQIIRRTTRDDGVVFDTKLGSYCTQSKAIDIAKTITHFTNYQGPRNPRKPIHHYHFNEATNIANR